MKLTILGSGDAFGSGGRMQTSLHLVTDERQLLIDCGATTLIAMAQRNLDPNDISAIVLTHLHGDHFSGLIWFLLHAKHVGKRRRPLTIVGPVGTRERLDVAAEALFPGSALTHTDFAMNFLQHNEIAPLDVDGISISAFQVEHRSGAPPYALRLEHEGCVVAFSGDTEWTDRLFDAAALADVFICECFAHEHPTPGHIAWSTLREKLPKLTAKSLYLTHMGPSMLANKDAINDPRVYFCEDGLIINVTQPNKVARRTRD